jgi:hypothetical protein
MSTTPRKKTHIYTVDVRKAEHHPGLRLFVRAESKAQARGFVAATMIVVERTEQDALLELTRGDVLDATSMPAAVVGSEDEQGPLLLTEPAMGEYRPLDDSAPIHSVHTTGRRPEPDAVDEAVRAFTDEPPRTAAEDLEEPR